MSLDHAILGFLNYRPFSGYDLKKVFDSSVRHFWSADQSQIYRTLARLAKKGLVEQQVIRQEDRPDRKVYHITPQGQSALADWLRSPLPPDDVRSAEFIQIFFAGQLSDDEIIAMFERFAAQMRLGLQMFDRVPRQMDAYSDTIQSEREFFFWLLTLEAGQRAAQANLEIVEDILTRLRSGEIPQEKKPNHEVPKTTKDD
jgi:PadR family transcriptional regulator AphA